MVTNDYKLSKEIFKYLYEDCGVDPLDVYEYCNEWDEYEYENILDDMYGLGEGVEILQQVPLDGIKKYLKMVANNGVFIDRMKRG